MTYQPQHFQAPDGTRMVVITADEYQRLRALDDEDARDIADGMAALARHEADGVTVPSEVVEMIIEGATPLRAWRRYRGITQKALAAAVGLSASAINALEQQPDRIARPENRRALAKALDMPVRALDID